MLTRLPAAAGEHRASPPCSIAYGPTSPGGAASSGKQGKQRWNPSTSATRYAATASAMAAWRPAAPPRRGRTTTTYSSTCSTHTLAMKIAMRVHPASSVRMSRARAAEMTIVITIIALPAFV